MLFIHRYFLPYFYHILANIMVLCRQWWSVYGNFRGRLLSGPGCRRPLSQHIVLLIIIGNVADEAQAADIALHFWYSAFIPMEYWLQIAMILWSFLQQSQDGEYLIRLGPTSTLHLCLLKDATVFFAHFVSSSFTVGNAQDEYNRVRTAHSRRDFRDRMYLGLKPSHRAAFKEYRSFGIVLPFGAMNAHFNRPNLSLFSPEGKWWQTDYADPLEGWE